MHQGYFAETRSRFHSTPLWNWRIPQLKYFWKHFYSLKPVWPFENSWINGYFYFLLAYWPFELTGFSFKETPWFFGPWLHENPFKLNWTDLVKGQAASSVPMPWNSSRNDRFGKNSSKFRSTHLCSSPFFKAQQLREPHSPDQLQLSKLAAVLQWLFLKKAPNHTVDGPSPPKTKALKIVSNKTSRIHLSGIHLEHEHTIRILF